MSTTFTAVYEKGILRPLSPLFLPENTRVEVHIVPWPARTRKTATDRQVVYDALTDAGLVETQAPSDYLPALSETELLEAAEALAVAGPISDLIIAERAESY